MVTAVFVQENFMFTSSHEVAVQESIPHGCTIFNVTLSQYATIKPQITAIERPHHH